MAWGTLLRGFGFIGLLSSGGSLREWVSRIKLKALIPMEDEGFSEKIRLTTSFFH
jgi:hypothetical protein